MRKWIIIIAFLSISGCASSAKLAEKLDWKRVYVNDENGKTVYGNVNDLISSIRSGKEIRLEFSFGRGILYYADATNIWIKGNLVYAQNTTGISVEFKGSKLQFKPDTYHYWFIVDTQGHMDRIRWNVGEPVLRDHDKIDVAVSWFVR
jgi:hypothetical protein